MGFQLSQGPYKFNRFDEYESKTGASTGEGSQLDEVVAAAASAGDGKVPTNKKGKLDFDKMYNKLQDKKAMKKEENSMNSYVNAVSSMAANPSFGGSDLMEKKGSKKGSKPDFPDVDGDGDTEESIASATKSAKKKLEKCESIEDAFMVGFELSEEIDNIMEESMASRMEKGYNKNIDPSTGKKKEGPKKDEAAAGKKKAYMKMMNKAAGRPYRGVEKPGAGKRLDDMSDKIAKVHNEQVAIDREDVIDWLIAEDYVSNQVSAEVMFEHISDDFLAAIEADITNWVLTEQAD